MISIEGFSTVTKPYSDDELMDIISAYKTYGSIRKTADAVGVDRGVIQRCLKKASQRGLLGFDPVLPGFELQKITTVTNADGDTVREFIQQKPEVESQDFEMPEGHKLKGISAYVKEGKVQGAWYKTKELQEDPLQMAKAIKEVLQDCRGAWDLGTEPQKTNPEELTVYPIVDWHIGLYASLAETGTDWNLDIGERVILSAMDRVMTSSPNSDTAIILGLGDLLHFDNFEAKTERSGNSLDASGRYPEVLKRATRMIIWTIEKALQKHKKVIVRILPGNHDDKAAVAISFGLALKYENHPRVQVADEDSRWWWYRFGKVFIGANHSDRVKMKDMPLIMAADRPEDWYQSTYKKIYTGHRHHENKIEEGGVIVECLRTPVAKDAFHSFEKFRSGRTVYSETYTIDGKTASYNSYNI